MNDKDKWSAHLEYMKTAITIAAAILAIAATIYSDPTKIPHDFDKIILLLSVICVLVTLISAIMAVIALSNFLIRVVPSNPTEQDRVAETAKAASITWWSGGAFFGLIGAGICLALFFSWRAMLGDLGASGVQPSLDQIIANVKEVVQAQGPYPAQAVKLTSVEAQGTGYVVDLSIDGKPETYEALYDPGTAAIKKITRK